MGEEVLDSNNLVLIIIIMSVKRKIKQSEEINTTKEINQSVKEKQEILNNKMKEYKGLNFYEITQKMAKENYNENIDQDYINKVLNTQI